MKKHLLSLLVATSSFGLLATPPLHLDVDAGSIVIEGRQLSSVDAMPGAPAVEIPQLQTVKLSPRVMKTAAVTEEPSWGEWQEFSTGRTESTYNSITPFTWLVLDKVYYKPVTVYSRESNDGAKQYKISGMLKDQDFILNYDPDTDRLHWPEFETNAIDIFNSSSSFGDGYEKFEKLRFVESSDYRSGRIYDYGISINAFLMCAKNIETGYGSGFEAGFFIRFDGKKSEDEYIHWKEDNLFIGNKATLVIDEGLSFTNMYCLMARYENGKYIVGDKSYATTEEITTGLLTNPKHTILNSVGEHVFETVGDGANYLLSIRQMPDGSFSTPMVHSIFVHNSTPDRWVNIGKVQYKEPDYYEFKTDAYSDGYLELDLERNLDKPNRIRVKNPYNINYNLTTEGAFVRIEDNMPDYRFPGYFWTLYTVDDNPAHDYYLVMDISETGDVTLLPNGTRYYLSQCDGPLIQNETNMVLGQYTNLRQGKMFDGNLILPDDYPALVTAIEGTIYKVLRIPPGTAKVYADMDRRSDATAKEIIDRMKEGIADGTLEGETPVDGRVEDVDFNNYDNVNYILVTMAVDAAGNIIATDVLEFLLTEWEPAGTAIYHEQLIGNLFSSYEPVSYEVPFYRHKIKENVYAVSELYVGKTNWPYSSNVTSEPMYNYLELNCVDRDHVYIGQHYIGLNLSNYGLYLYPYYYPDDNEPNLSYTGTLSDDGKFRMPERSVIIVKAPSTIYYNGGAFELDLPLSFAGVEDVVDDNDDTKPVVYYNMQGIKIDNPQPGKLYITVQGSKTSKIIYRH